MIKVVTAKASSLGSVASILEKKVNTETKELSAGGFIVEDISVVSLPDRELSVMAIIKYKGEDENV